MSYHIYTVFLSLSRCWLVTQRHCSFMFAGWLIWILIGPISAGATKVRARQAYLTVGSSEGTEEEQEPLDRSLASSCSPGACVAKALFDVIHLRGLPLIVSASGTPWPPPTLHTDDSDKRSYKHTPHPLRPHPYLLWNHTGTENSQSHIPLHIKVDKRMKGFVYKQFK